MLLLSFSRGPSRIHTIYKRGLTEATCNGGSGFGTGTIWERTEAAIRKNHPRSEQAVNSFRLLQPTGWQRLWAFYTRLLLCWDSFLLCSLWFYGKREGLNSIKCHSRISRADDVVFGIHCCCGDSHWLFYVALLLWFQNKHFISVNILLYCIISCTPDWPQTHYVAEDNLEFWSSCVHVLNTRTAGVYHDTWVRQCCEPCLQSKPSTNTDPAPYNSFICYWAQLVNTFVQDAYNVDSTLQLLCLCLGARQSWPHTTTCGLHSLKFWVSLWESVLFTGDKHDPVFFLHLETSLHFSLLRVLDFKPTVYVSR